MNFMVCLVAVAGISAASAQEAKIPPGPPPHTMKLTYTQIQAVHTGLMSLDGYQKIIEEGGKTKAIFKSYELSKDTRAAISHDEVSLEEPIAKVSAEIRHFAKPLGEAVDVQGSKERRAFVDFANDEGERVFDVDIIKINFDELKLDDNGIPPSVITAIAPIMEKQ